VVFGTSGNLRTRAVGNQMSVTAPFSPVVFMGHLTRAATPVDQVRLVITLDRTEVLNEVEQPSTFQCLGTDKLETDLGAGTYVVRMYVNEQVAAEGTLVVQ
jgi:hypothetical protein